MLYIGKELCILTKMSIFYDFIFMGFDWCVLYVLNYESMFEFLLINIIRQGSSRSMLIIQWKEFNFCLDLYCFIPRNTEHMIQTSSDCVTLYRFVLFANLEKFVSKQVAPSNCKTHIRALLSSYNYKVVANWTLFQRHRIRNWLAYLTYENIL